MDGTIPIHIRTALIILDGYRRSNRKRKKGKERQEEEEEEKEEEEEWILKEDMGE